MIQIIKPVTKKGIETENFLDQDTVEPTGTDMGVKLLVAIAVERNEGKYV